MDKLDDPVGTLPAKPSRIITESYKLDRSVGAFPAMHYDEFEFKWIVNMTTVNTSGRQGYQGTAAPNDNLKAQRCPKNQQENHSQFSMSSIAPAASAARNQSAWRRPLARLSDRVLPFEYGPTSALSLDIEFLEALGGSRPPRRWTGACLPPSTPVVSCAAPESRCL